MAVVLVVDDHEGMRALVRTLFELDRPGDVLVEAGTAAEAVAAFEEHRPDVVVLDQMLGTSVGLEDVAEPIPRVHPDTPILVFTAYLSHPVGMMTVLDRRDFFGNRLPFGSNMCTMLEFVSSPTNDSALWPL